MSLAVNTKLPPFKELKQKPSLITVDRRDDGTVYLSSQYAVEEPKRSLVHLLVEKALQHPGRDMLAERDATGLKWNAITYGEADRASSAVASALLARGLTVETPLLILSGNSIAHAVMTLGAMKAGVPVVPVSVPYSTASSDFAKLRHVVSLTRPGMIFAENAGPFLKAIAALDLGLPVVTCEGDVPGAETIRYAEMIRTPVSSDVARSMDRVGLDTVCKYIFTSGSTGMPKGVIQTQRMLTAQVVSQDAARTEPVDGEGLRTLEWMPWSHISAGNLSFTRNISFGGTIYLDTGKPVPGHFDETIRNLREVSPSYYNSAPIAFGMLVEAMEKDLSLRECFFRELEFMAYGGATMSSDVYERMQTLAIAETGYRIPFLTVYGATETQGITGVHWITERVGLIGVPLPGATLKLVPNGNKLEVRAKGPTITPGYLRDPQKTKEAFDEEGFYSLGDAACFLDPQQPEQGLIFDGRVTEDFKLSSGTWVSTGTLRADLLAACSPLVQDAVICGLDQSFIAVLAWPNITAARELAGLPASATPQEITAHPKVVAFMREKIALHNKQGGSSTRVVRIHLMTEPPSVDHGEITEKGYVNQRATLERRAHLVKRLYQEPPAGDVILL